MASGGSTRFAGCARLARAPPAARSGASRPIRLPCRCSSRCRREPLKIAGMQPMGNYAYSIALQRRPRHGNFRVRSAAAAWRRRLSRRRLTAGRATQLARDAASANYPRNSPAMWQVGLNLCARISDKRRRHAACRARLRTFETTFGKLIPTEGPTFPGWPESPTARAVARQTPPISQRLHPSQFAEGLLQTMSRGTCSAAHAFLVARVSSSSSSFTLISLRP